MGSDKTATSQPFVLSFGPEFTSVPFQMLLQPKDSNVRDPTPSFQKSNGKGCLELKCMAEAGKVPAANIRFRFSVGIGQNQPPSDQVENDFSQNGICRPYGARTFDFTPAASKNSVV